jgi:hypothetical protein
MISSDKGATLKGRGFKIEYKEVRTWKLRKFGNVFRNTWGIPTKRWRLSDLIPRR